MSVYKKLMDARIRLLDTDLKKTGLNKFAGYSYFELADFIPSIQRIFAELGLCGVVSYTAEIAQLTITDIESDKSIVITSPMESANLKGCHPIQNLGAVETYQRRYLWVTAMEILEHDALDGSDPNTAPKNPPPKPKEQPVSIATISTEQINTLMDLLIATDTDEKQFCEMGRILSIEKMPSNYYDGAIRKLKNKLGDIQAEKTMGERK